MLEQLKFVQGAVGKKDLMPALTHYKIENGTIRSYNGTLALCSPINLDINCIPKAAPFYKAIQSCNDTVSLSLTTAGRLNVRSASFNAFIDCVDIETPHVTPEGDLIQIDGVALLEALRILKPLIGDDASRPWSNGVLFKGECAYATNNVILTEYNLGVTFPKVCNIPRDCINEMLRIKEPPISMQVNANGLAFNYEGGRWIWSSLLVTEWPDIAKILNVACNPLPINPELFNALNVVEPFSDKVGRVYIFKDTLSTSLEQGDGAKYTINGLGFEGVYQIQMLNKLNGVAKTADFSTYPRPCLFFGDRLRGAIIGLRA